MQKTAIKKLGNCFCLSTKHTTYCFQILESGHPEHLYYGKKLKLDFIEADSRMQESFIRALSEKRVFGGGNQISYSKEFPELNLENICLEFSSYGKGDIREPFVELSHGDGNRTCDFLFDKAEITEGKAELETLPSSYDDTKTAQQLRVEFVEKTYKLRMVLTYTVFPECDCITRSVLLKNESGVSVTIQRLMSLQLDLQGVGYKVTGFHGHWAREMEKHELTIRGGKYVNSSVCGESSSRANPFFMVSEEGTTETAGSCYGFNLIYSGNHYEAVEASPHDKTRIVAGINPTDFAWKLSAGACFEAPEAVMTWSGEGHRGMSLQMHEFVREHIVRGAWKNRVRPILINSWEAAYFKFSQKGLLKLAKEAADAGMELFVLDDGWFGKRDNDACSLGDWVPNRKKLPEGVKGLADSIRGLGMKFGIWVEPEMVNEDSDLYRAHPEYAVTVPGQPHSEGRNQMLLDLTRTEVQDYCISSIREVLGSAPISYVKWDMNRIFSDAYSGSLPPVRQGEFFHRYELGLYRVMKVLTEEFPDILFEGCSAGGNRFDLGILCYMPQIWASDNTDAYCRYGIQEGYSYGYPMSVVSAHVSACPNHQTLRVVPLETRFAVAAFGLLGYECNLCDMSEAEKEQIKQQILTYKKWRECLQFGNFYRIEEGKWVCVSKDGEKAVGMLFRPLAAPNRVFESFRTTGLKEDSFYHFYNEKKKYEIERFGDLINTVSPVHVKQGSLVQSVVSRFVKMDGETEDYILSGNVLNESGVKLAPAFGATGYNDKVRFCGDFSSRLYYMEEIKP